jgi:hypothetical protein
MKSKSKPKFSMRCQETLNVWSIGAKLWRGTHALNFSIYLWRWVFQVSYSK